MPAHHAACPLLVEAQPAAPALRQVVGGPHVSVTQVPSSKVGRRPRRERGDDARLAHPGRTKDQERRTSDGHLRPGREGRCAGSLVGPFTVAVDARVNRVKVTE